MSRPSASAKAPGRRCGQRCRKWASPETAFLTQCSSSFKQGTKFSGWVTGDQGDYYYHPFSAPAGYSRINLVPYWQNKREKVSFVDAVSVQGHLCDRGLAPKQDSTPEFAHVANYAYHLDAGKFAELLHRHCTKSSAFDISSITSQASTASPRGYPLRQHEQSGDIEGDLFVDCTGFAALLLGKHYKVPYVDKRHILFNDSALAVQVPYAE